MGRLGVAVNKIRDICRDIAKNNKDIFRKACVIIAYIQGFTELIEFNIGASPGHQRH